MKYTHQIGAVYSNFPKFGSRFHCRSEKPCGMMPRMLYYYVVPCYLTGVFMVAYLVVRLILGVFDLANPFWDAWDRWKRAFPPLGLLEFVILAAFIYYIVYFELSGAPEPTQKESFWQILRSYF